MPSKIASSRRQRRSEYKETDPSVVVYRGPIGLSNQTRTMGELRTVEMRWTDTIYSSATGTITNVVANNPSLAEDWSNYAAIFNEYRVLGFKMEFLPANKYNKSNATTVVPGYVVLDNESSSSLSSLAQAAAYSTAKFVSLDEPFMHVARMSDVEQADFVATSSVASAQWIKLFFTGLANSVLYGSIHVTLMVQFKGQR